MENSINKYDLLKVVEIVNGIGSSKNHYVSISHCTNKDIPLRVFIHKRYSWGESKECCDMRIIHALGADDIEWLSYWKTVIERERKEDESN